MSILDVSKCKNSYITSILDNKKPVDDPKDTANFIIFHSNKPKPNQSLNIKIDDTCIKQVVSAIKYLDVMFDSNLTWKNRINDLCRKLSKAVGILSKVRHFVNQGILRLVTLYFSLSYPFLTYGVYVWSSTFPSFLTPLFVIQKKAIRTISFSEPKSHSAPLFKFLNLLNLDDIIKLQILPFVYQLSHGYIYRLVLMNISNLPLLLVPILHANRVMETFMYLQLIPPNTVLAP